MIKHYGADAVRWFILSDSPPEKDVQWSDTGVSSASKFLQKVWNLNDSILKRKESSADKKIESKFELEINNYVMKIDNSIKNFRFNVSIAHFYEIYNLFKKNFGFKISNKVFTESIIKIMKLLIPFTPHLAHECLELLKSKSINNWPVIDKKIISQDLKIAIQINGKTRDIVTIKKDLSEKEITKIVLVNSKVKKYIENKDIAKTIFVKNKIMNYIILDK